ncbi:hypothetical protein BDZ91DRAFT_782159, partial [Kalaharituber pfeilii]
MAQQGSPQLRKPTGRDNLVNAVDAFSNLLLPDEKKELNQTEIPNDILALTKALKDARVSEKKINRCEAFLQSVHQFAGVIDTMIQHNASISALVWGSVRILLLTAQNFVRYFSALSELLEKLGKLCPIFKEFRDLWPHYEGLQDAVFEFYAQMVNFCTNALVFLRKSSAKTILKALLQPLHGELQDVEKKLTFQHKIVDYQVTLARDDTLRKIRLQQTYWTQPYGPNGTDLLYSFRSSFLFFLRDEALLILSANPEFRVDVQSNKWEEHRKVELQALAGNTQSIQSLQASAKSQLSKTRDKVLNMELKREDQRKYEERQRQLRRISDYDYTMRFLECANTSYPRTGEWLYQRSEYKEWVQARCPAILWCYGIPGSGKSVLSTSIVKHLLDTCFQPGNSGSGKTFIGYFFCTFSDHRSLKFEEIIRSLIKQVLSVFHGSTKFKEDLAGFFEQCNNIPSTDLWQDLFIRTCRVPKHIYLILDG